MKFPISIFSFFPKESPIRDLIKHYDFIEKGSKLIPETFACYAEPKKSKDFDSLKQQVDEIEEQADRVKRKIRNHMPRGIFMPVDRTIFFNFTRSLDDVLDCAQDALNWLSIRHVKVPSFLRKDLDDYLQNILVSVKILRPALEGTIEIVGGGTANREEVKTLCRNIILHHDEVGAQKRAIIAKLYNADIPFKDMYQLLKFIEEMYDSSHNTERCSDMLRAMLAK